MRFKELLLEYNVEYTKRTFGDKLIKRYSTGPDKPLNYLNYSKDTVLDEILKNLENGDPTPNYKYVPWIVREYINGNLKRFEDLGLLRHTLEAFEKYKNSNNFIEFAKSNLPDISDIKNIFNYDVTTIRKLMADYMPKKKLVDKGDSIEFYSDETVRVIQPLNVVSACYYGQGTQWCTAATEGPNYFNEYVIDGPLYILLPTNPKYIGEKFQLHIPSEQFSNEKDEMLPLERLVFRFPKFVEYLKKNSSPVATRMLNYFLATADKEVVLKIWEILVTDILQTANLMLRGSKELDYSVVDSEPIVPKKQKIISRLIKLKKLSVPNIMKITSTASFYDMIEGSDIGWLTLAELKDVLVADLINQEFSETRKLAEYVQNHIYISLDKVKYSLVLGVVDIPNFQPIIISRV